MKRTFKCLALLATLAVQFANAGQSQPTKPTLGRPARSGREEKLIVCDDTKLQRVKVNFGRITILSFPLPPKEILPGEAVFDFRQIKGDLAIKALRPSARTNIAVYLPERRCSFDLVTVPSGGDDILFVRDPVERKFEVKFHE